MRGITAVMVLVGACGPGSYELEPMTTDGECPTLDCPIMAGGELVTRPVLYTDVGELQQATHVSVFPPELADVVIDGHDVVIRARELPTGTEPSASAPGQGVLRVTLESGASFDRVFSVAARASTTLVPDRDRVPFDAFAERKLPGERLALFEGEAVLVIAEHRAADATRLLGHGSESWASEGIQLADLPDAYGDSYDRVLMRAVRGTASGAARVSVGTAALEIDVVPPGSTAMLEVIDRGQRRLDATTRLELYPGQTTMVSLLAYADDGRYIYGGPPYLPLEIVSSDPAVVDRDDDRRIYPDREIWLAGYRSGTATLTFRFDGLTIDVPVSVE